MEIYSIFLVYTKVIYGKAAGLTLALNNSSTAIVAYILFILERSQGNN
jgi:hypothetical protein